VSAAGIPVAYLTAQVGSHPRWFQAGKNRAGAGDRRFGRQRGTPIGACPGAKHAISSHDQPCESRAAKALGFHEVIDTSREKPGDGVRRITAVTAQTL